jgi:hypothetical protein
MINHNIVRLDISVHNSLAMAEVQRLGTVSSNSPHKHSNPYLQQLQNVISNIEVDELGVERSEIRVVDVLEDKGGRFTLHEI